uniref:Aminopeptidase n=1 Tax=Diabrotica virgifera virgifera TaxID=50390 RepID=A0A6P7FT09_DIAVI
MVPIILLSLVSLTWAAPDLLLDADQLLEPKLQRKSEISDSDYRLSATTVPSKYDLLLNIPRECLEGKSKTFSGLVKIVFSVSESKESILIHSLVKIMNITAIELESSQILDVVGHDVCFNKTQMVEIKFARNLNVGVAYKLQIHFTGQLNASFGIFRNKYLDDGVTEYLVATQFQTHYARSAFPCFDEPQYKAIFRLTLIYPSDFHATANTPIEDSQYNNETNTATTSFEDSPVMSTYLLAFTISKFNCSTATSNGITHEVCSRRDTASQRDFALEYGVKILNVLGTWTQLPYDTLGIKKISQYGLISFPYGGMENWGLVTYPESIILSSLNDIKNKVNQGMLRLIAHEFSHMWFGNYATTKWWDTLFLNEGFATYFEYFILNEIPELTELEMNKEFIVEAQFSSLENDGYPSSKALTSRIIIPTEIFKKLTIIYNKGASIIRMIENTVGFDKFKHAVQNYLVQRAYNWSTPEILWSLFSNEFPGGQLTPDVKFVDFVDNWANRPGYPLVNVSVVGSNILLTQQRFLYRGQDEYNTKWYIPVVYTVFNETYQYTSTIWLKPGSEGVTIKNVVNDNTLVILNPDSLGYYRVNYDKLLRDKITAQLEKEHTKISDLTRAKIINDAAALVKAGFINSSDALEFLNYMKNEDSFYPWKTALKSLSSNKQAKELLLKNVEHLAARMSSTNLNEIDHVTFRKLSTICNFACSNRIKQCSNGIKRMCKELRDNNISVSNEKNFLETMDSEFTEDAHFYKFQKFGSKWDSMLKYQPNQLYLQ